MESLFEHIVHEANVPLSRITTMSVGGPCRYYVVPKSVEDIRFVTAICERFGWKLLIIGNGSNVLAGDEGFDGVVMHVGKGLKEYGLKDGELYAEAGVALPRLAYSMANEGIAGFDFMAGIPGSVGGGLVMNAGCIGKEIGDVVSSVTHVSDTGEVITSSAEELQFSFRRSWFLDRRHIIVSARFRAEPATDSAQVMEATKRAADIRKGKFPINVKTVGSTFKSPPEGPHPGRLIEEVGLKGFVIGGAQISTVHANWIINQGSATASDVKRLIELMQTTVAKQLGIQMEPEVLFV